MLPVNCQRSQNVMADIQSGVDDGVAEVYLLQEPYIYIAFGRVCGLGNALDVYWVGDHPKAAIAVRKGSFDAIFSVEWSNECLCAVHVSRNDTLVSLYCQFADEIDQDINSIG
ncbi:hypothetical protein Zmor_005976 [Zophobas morio]|uniref:Uncharacterized protein n=1 Tax=Zophobas morio TaxID=2755281 RepID=A0AA38IST0_9CUCU|nr:hypothetical protein Zmor_005976 [Zophobas morio]